MGNLIRNNDFDLPPPAKLPNSDLILPHVIFGDAAFPLLNNLMKPFPNAQSTTNNEKAIYNYRLSRARRVVENAFGILSQTFRIYYVPINISLDAIDDLIFTTCMLHNLILDNPSTHNQNIDEELELELPSDNLLPLHIDNIDQIHQNDIRNQFKHYFNNEGSVEWQNNIFSV